MMRPFPAVTGIIAALAACFDGPTVPSDAAKVAFHIVPEATFSVSGFREPAEFVVRDQVGWEQFWDEFVQGRPPTMFPEVAMPTFGFDSQIVVAVALGVRDPEYTVRIEDVRQSEGRLYVVVQEVQLVGCVVNSITRTPVATVVVDSRLDDVQFLNRQSTDECPWDPVPSPGQR